MNQEEIYIPGKTVHSDVYLKHYGVLGMKWGKHKVNLANTKITNGYTKVRESGYANNKKFISKNRNRAIRNAALFTAGVAAMKYSSAVNGKREALLARNIVVDNGKIVKNPSKGLTVLGVAGKYAKNIGGTKLNINDFTRGGQIRDGYKKYNKGKSTLESIKNKAKQKATKEKLKRDKALSKGKTKRADRLNKKYKNSVSVQRSATSKLNALNKQINKDKQILSESKDYKTNLEYTNRKLRLAKLNRKKSNAIY